MEKSTGIHFYINILNLNEIIKGEENANDEVKRSIHRLHTYFSGLTKVIKYFNGELEKFTNGRAHIYFEKTEGEENESYYFKVVRAIIAAFTFCYDVFNGLGKYSAYTKFKVQGGADYGDFYKYEITGMDEFTTIGAVANVAAKITNFAPAGYIYITDDLYDMLREKEREKFTLLEETKLKEIQESLKGSPLIYSAKYSSFSEEDMQLDDLMVDIKEYCQEISNNLNLSEMEFEDARSKINFTRLSRKKNKKITAGILFADLRGFTKLFNVSGNNLDNLVEVLQTVYIALNDSVSCYDGVRVQFQGDRIVAVFNSFNDEKDYAIIRMFESALKIKDEVVSISDANQELLGSNKLKIGIGLCYGEYYATRLGIKNNMDNLVIGTTVIKGDIAEDKYAGDKEIVVTKEFKEFIDSVSDNSIKYKVILECLTSISTTGFYKTDLSTEDYNNKIKDKTEELSKKAREIAIKAVTADKIITPIGKERNVRPWRILSN